MAEYGGGVKEGLYLQLWLMNQSYTVRLTQFLVNGLLLITKAEREDGITT
jgi:hypothetical protein